MNPINFQFDLSLNTLILSGVVLVVGWGLKAVAWAVIEAIKALVTKLAETIGKVEVLDAKLSEVVKTIGDVEKLRNDVNSYYARLKKLEARFENNLNGSDE